MTRYIGLVDGHDGAWGVVIPDFPGCHGGGATIETAVQDATSALREFAADMLADGEVLPVARTLHVIEQEQDAAGEPRSTAVFVRLIRDHARTVKATISLDAGVLVAIDEEAKARGMTRSGFLASAALLEISKGG